MARVAKAISVAQASFWPGRLTAPSRKLPCAAQIGMRYQSEREAKIGVAGFQPRRDFVRSGDSHGKKKRQEGFSFWRCADCGGAGNVQSEFVNITLLNRASNTDFVRCLGAIYEHSPWVAQAAAARRPFQGVDDLHAAMRQSVEESGAVTQRALVCAHPDLAGRLARAGGLQPSSTQEQAGLGLDRLSDEDYAIFDNLNRAYRDKFAFPFVIAVKRHSRESILEAFRARLHNDAEQELRAALDEIHLIARFRLDALIEPEPTPRTAR